MELKFRLFANGWVSRSGDIVVVRSPVGVEVHTPTERVAFPTEEAAVAYFRGRPSVSWAIAYGVWKAAALQA